MVTFLFWNLNRKPLQDTLAHLADEHQVDVVMLAECEVDDVTMLEALNPEGSEGFRLTEGFCDKVTIYARFDRRFIHPIVEDARFSIRSLALPAQTEILLVVAHLPSKLYQNEASQVLDAAGFAEAVRRAERDIGHERTVVVGDLNMDPYEHGVVGASALNATMTRNIAERGMRTVEGQEYPFFYNPMWSRFGDASPGPPGTYYYSRTEQVQTFWHMFDQVLVRPDLLGRFRTEDLTILTEAGTMSLLDHRGLPDRSAASDHLPVLFALNL